MQRRRIVKTSIPSMHASHNDEQQTQQATKGDTMTMTKAKMIARIRSMQKEMGCPPCKAKTLRVHYSEAEVRDMYFSTCQTHDFWCHRNWLENGTKNWVEN